jgi:putative tryptophan/tyrosine transport system substrate-binding protein
MRRREFIMLLGGAAGWPLAARAQQPQPMRRIGVLMLYAENDAEGQLRAKAFRQQLEKTGWTVGRDLQIDYHWGVGDEDWVRSVVAEVLRSPPEVIVVNTAPAAQMVQQASRTVPAIFIGSDDPVGDSLVRSLAHPGGNMTGFTVMEASVGTKFLELLKEIAPHIARVAVLLNPESLSSQGILRSARAAAQGFGVEISEAPVHDAAEIEAAMAKSGQETAGGLIVPADPATNGHRKLIVELAIRYRLPAIYGLRAAAIAGGLISYGVDLPELFRQAAAYADRMLRGEKPADLPVQRPTKYELVINLKTAKALGIEVSPSLLARADEVVE